MKGYVAVALLCLAGASPCLAQSTAEYHRSSPQYWVTDTRQRLYLVRGGDTIGDPVRILTAYMEAWEREPRGFNVLRTTAHIDLAYGFSTDTLTIDRRGRVLEINGGKDYGDGDWDAFLRLPASGLAVGTTWSDTLRYTYPGPREGLYEARQRYEVTRRLEGREGDGLEIVVRGEVRLHGSSWSDSSAGSYSWHELAGPVEERFVFDPEMGQIYRRSWELLLTGIGGEHDGAITDTVPAGMWSRHTRRRVLPAHGLALMAELPGPDRSVTFQGENDYLFIHGQGRSGDSLYEGYRRPDGRAGTAEITLGADGPRTWSFSWVAPDTPSRTLRFEARGGILMREGDQLSPPTEFWGIAPEGMSGVLGPSLARIPDGQRVEFAINRPETGRWERVIVGRRSIGSANIYHIHNESTADRLRKELILIFDANGHLLFERIMTATAPRTLRVPASAERQQLLMSILSQLGESR